MKLLVMTLLLTFSLSSFAGIRCNMLMNSSTHETAELVKIDQQIIELKNEVSELNARIDSNFHSDFIEILEDRLEDTSSELKSSQRRRVLLAAYLKEIQISIVNSCGILTNASFR